MASTGRERTKCAAELCSAWTGEGARPHASFEVGLTPIMNRKSSRGHLIYNRKYCPYLHLRLVGEYSRGHHPKNDYSRTASRPSTGLRSSGGPAEAAEGGPEDQLDPGPGSADRQSGE